MAGATEQLNPAVPQPGGTSVANTMQPLEAPTWPPEYAARALEAAPAKLAAVMEEAPLGRLAVSQGRRRLLVPTILAVFAGACLFRSFTSSSSWTVAIFGWAYLLIAIDLARKAWRLCPSSPANAVRAACVAVQTRNFEYLDRLRVSSDRNATSRITPGQPQSILQPLSTPAELKAYWQEIRNRFDTPYGVSLLSAHSRRINDQVHVVTARIQVNSIDLPAVVFTLALTAGAFLPFAVLDALLGKHIQVMLPFLTMPSAAILYFMAYQTFAGRVVTLRKLVVKCGTQWRLFSGELQAPEERDLSWLAQQNN